MQSSSEIAFLTRFLRLNWVWKVNLRLQTFWDYKAWNNKWLTSSFRQSWGFLSRSISLQLINSNEIPVSSYFVLYGCPFSLCLLLRLICLSDYRIIRKLHSHLFHSFHFSPSLCDENTFNWHPRKDITETIWKRVRRL